MRIAAAVDIGGTRTKIGVVSHDGRVLESQSVATPARGEGHALVDAISNALRPVIDGAAAMDLAPIIGVSVAGFLDAARSMMYGNANLPLLCNFPLRSSLEDRLDRDVILEVDSNAAALAEHHYGAGRNAKRLLAVTVGTGLGGGVILDGELLRYNGQCAGDLGHIMVASGGEGRRCTCGANGCLEAMVCSDALSERAQRKPVRDIIRSAREGDPASIRALAQTARWLGVGLASLAALFAPDTITVGGGIAAAGELLLTPTRESYRSAAANDHRDRVRIVGSSFEGWEGIVGAAAVVFETMATEDAKRLDGHM